MKKLIYLLLTVLIVACSTDDDNNNDLQKEWLYTHTSLEATATNSTTIVIPITDDIFAFTDRPNREHKYISGDEFTSYWNDYDDVNSFKLDPPNAVLTWVDADGVTEVEVVITDADFDGDNIIYTIENSTITANQSFEDVSLFVDGNGSSNNVYLASNGVTIKASEGAVAGDTGVLNGITYTISDEFGDLIEGNNGDLSKIVTTLITDMSYMFEIGGIGSNQDISSWDVSNVTNFNSMFSTAGSFNSDISSWDVSNVTDMGGMFFQNYAFDQDISSWDVSNVTYMSQMFNVASAFDQDISSWDLSNVESLDYMFAEATSFNQDLSSWSVNNVTYCERFSNGATSWTLPQPNFTNCNPN